MQRSLLISSALSGVVLVGGDSQDRVQGLVDSISNNTEIDAALQEMSMAAVDSDADFWPSDEDDSFLHRVRPYRVRDGILHIPVQGVLLHRFPYNFGSLVTGYEYIWRAFDRGMRDSAVKGVALIVDSPGGLVSGNFELVDHLTDSATKPVRAFVADQACSAAYNIAAAADEVVATRSSVSGSIGAFMIHMDVSKMMEEMGFTVSIIQFGEHKTDGNPMKSLSPAARERFQQQIDKVGNTFAGMVAENRAMDIEDVLETQGRTYDVDEAVELGLVDDIGSLEDGLNDYYATLEGDEPMAAGTRPERSGRKTNASGEEGQPSASAEEIDQKVSDSYAAGKEKGYDDGVKAERERIKGIMTCEEAKGRESMASELAFDEDMAFTASSANKILGKMAKPEAVGPKNEGEEEEDEAAGGAEASSSAAGSKAKSKAKPGNHFDEHMSKNAPNVGQAKGRASASGEPGEDEDELDQDDVLAQSARSAGMSRMKASPGKDKVAAE